MNTVKRNAETVLVMVCFAAGVVLLILDAFKSRFSQQQVETGFVEVSEQDMDELRQAVRRFHEGTENATWIFRDGLAQGQVQINDKTDALYMFKEYESLVNATLRFVGQHDN